MRRERRRGGGINAQTYRCPVDWKTICGQHVPSDRIDSCNIYFRKGDALPFAYINFIAIESCVARAKERNCIATRLNVIKGEVTCASDPICRDFGIGTPKKDVAAASDVVYRSADNVTANRAESLFRGRFRV
jgi:hypothetical protein